ncbi:MAG TPA: hypothetical protein VJN93_04540 [Candidatus Acidoferrum sp.]|nr:hypothetical protein [Candidatus Acidoferrum sp.]
MRDESTKQAAQEFLATKLTEEEQKREEKVNRETAAARALHVWKSFRGAIEAQCKEWNSVTGEESLTCKETPLGDLRVWCPATAKQLTVHFDSRKLTVTLKNGGRKEHEEDAVLLIEGYATETGRDARLVRNNEPANLEMVILGELRVLSGIGRQRTA